MFLEKQQIGIKALLVLTALLYNLKLFFSVNIYNIYVFILDQKSRNISFCCTGYCTCLTK